MQINVKDAGYAAIGDGTSHPLSEGYATLAAAQAVYSFVTDLAQQIDWAAIQKAANTLSSTGGTMIIPDGNSQSDPGCDFLGLVQKCSDRELQF